LLFQVPVDDMLHIVSQNIVKGFSVQTMFSFLEQWLTHRTEDVQVM